jgi:hypothetical protein
MVSGVMVDSRWDGAYSKLNLLNKLAMSAAAWAPDRGNTCLYGLWSGSKIQNLARRMR